MKNIYILLLSLSFFTLNKIAAQTTMQASIGPGPVVVGGTGVQIYMKALRPSAGATTETISTLDFNIAVREADYTTPPVVTVASNVFGITWTVETALLEGGFWNFHILKSVEFNYSFTTDMETPVMVVELKGGAPIPIATPLNVSLVTLTDGGTTQSAVFYCTGTINSVGTNLYYTRPAENGFQTTAVNGDSYRPVTPNSTLGTSPSIATISPGVLPVKFTGFNALKRDNDAMLTWQVENESPLTDRYEIERSLNGVDFRKVYTITPKNNGRSSNTYSLTDPNLSAIRTSGVFYYHVKQIDKDGRFVYSDIKNLRLNAAGMVVSVSPNPVRDIANISMDSEQDATANITVTDASGKQVQAIKMQVFKGQNIKKVNMAALPVGSYVLKVQTTSETKTVTVVKGH